LRHWIEQGGITPAAIEAHLSSLFPEVRPRRYFEVRSIDALPLSMYAAPVVMVTGLAIDPDAMRQADRLLGDPDTAWLTRAARSGMRDASLAERAGAIARLAVAACRARPDMCSADDVDAAEEFFRRFTERGRSPADTTNAGKPVSPAA
jgi:glutamate--cysteine ligase